MLLINKPQTSFVYFGKKLHLNLSFDVVLKVYKLFKEDIFSDIEKLNITLEMLITNNHILKKNDYAEKEEILKIIFNEFISSKNENKTNNKKIFDFYQDAEYIYASFFQAYGIDLLEEQGKMPWQKFIALFQGLPAGTKICEVISIRTREIPEPNKYNTKEIQALQDAKRIYALKIDNQETETFQDDVNRFGTMLISSAKKER